MSLVKLKWAAIISFIVAMTVLLGGGYFALDKVAPYPGKVVGPDGKVLFTKQDIMAGQHVYQKYGLMDHGSVWGHGSQRGPEFSALTLHLIGKAGVEQVASKEFGKPFEQLDDVQKQIAVLKNSGDAKTNRYDPATDTLTLTEAQVTALADVEKYWEKTFKEGDVRYGFLPNTIRPEKERLEISRFFFWTAWVAAAKRPDSDYSFTNNWPPDRTVGNVPTAATYIWSLGGLLSLILVLALFVYLIHFYKIWYGEAKGPALADKLLNMPLTSSQVKAAKFFLVVILLFLLQTGFGGLLAHYTIKPGSFWIQFVADYIPYSWAKTWHLQLAIFWVATTWVASAIYLAPILGGVEPKGQGALVQLLFAAILLVAVGSLAGEVAGIYGVMGDWWFWLGHQGWEYLELGRIWQILLFGGLIFWLLIVYRPISNHLKLKHKDDFNSLMLFYVLSAITVVLFFGFGLLYGPDTHLTVADYWRWFVVHIWVESIFEFFGVAVIALLLVVMGLASARAALTVAYFTATLVFLSGIIGTAHHYFWYGGPSYWLALGSVFSSMEPVPLIVLVVRGLMEYRSIRESGQDFAYKWPLYFLVASTFWNFLGAGVYGFLINLPIINYYEHATYLTMNHAHAAFFGTYGMLSLALLLFSWRGLVDKAHWNDGILKLSFWGFNAGLMLLTLGTLFPVGIMQLWTAFQEGLWVARSADFFERGAVVFFGTIRVVPDMMIIVLGVLPMVYFLFKTYPHLKPMEIKAGESVWKRMGIDEL